MKKFWIAGLVGLLLVLWVTPAGAITWGQPDTTHFYVGAMVFDHPDYGPYQVCSGTLIHPRVFLTAGHCTEGWEEDDVLWVNFDTDALNTDSLLDVAEIITHPEYEWGGANPHDVGALILAEPVTEITPATLPYPGFLDDLKKDGILRQQAEGAKFTVVGYGGTLEWPPPAIYYEDQRQVAISEYKALTQPFLHMSQNRLAGDGGTCFGDSGGPAFWVQEDGSEVLVGITSWGDAVCVATGFDYRVDIPETLDFIAEVIAALE